jgi:endonuclease III
MTNRRDRDWLAARRGELTPRRMSAALASIARFVGKAADALAVTRISKTEDPFSVLVATIISLRTRDEVTDVAAPRLLARAPTPAALACTPIARIAKLIYPAGFYPTKARTLRSLARTLLDEHGGRVPDTLEGLLALHGVGRKTANLVLTLGHGKPGICVDTHVHRISNRLGFVRTKTPDESELVLRRILPRRWWIPINDVLVAFGRQHCTPLSPHCSTCPVSHVCRRVGVTRSR